MIWHVQMSLTRMENERRRKYQQLCYELRERWDGYKVKIIPVVIGCLGGGMKRLKDDIRELFNDEKDLHGIRRELQRLYFGKAKRS